MGHTQVYVTHRSISRVDGIVGFPTLCILKLAIDEALVWHFHCHVVHFFGCLNAI